jgi:hypothetical protein
VTWLSEPIDQLAACRRVGRQVEHAVAQVGFGGRADHDGGALALHALQLGRRGMGGVHQVPAGIDVGVVQQPFDRALAGVFQAVVDFLRLLGDVDVHRQAGFFGAVVSSCKAAGLAARSECTATPALMRASPCVCRCTCSTMRITLSGVEEKRRWSSRRPAALKPERM